MLQKADKVYAAIDHTKFNNPTLYRVCGPKELDLLVTGVSAPADVVRSIKAAGVEVVLVDE